MNKEEKNNQNKRVECKIVKTRTHTHREENRLCIKYVIKESKQTKQPWNELRETVLPVPNPPSKLTFLC